MNDHIKLFSTQSSVTFGGAKKGRLHWLPTIFCSWRNLRLFNQSRKGWIMTARISCDDPIYLQFGVKLGFLCRVGVWITIAEKYCSCSFRLIEASEKSQDCYLSLALFSQKPLCCSTFPAGEGGTFQVKNASSLFARRCCLLQCNWSADNQSERVCESTRSNTPLFCQ